MTALTAVQVADFWIGAGGPRSRAVEWVAIAMGESSLEYDVVSPAGAIGLWQIMPFNAGPYGYSVQNLYDPAINARIAVLMSGYGVNCAAWDSAYANIYASGRYSYLAWPEVGSADYNNLTAAAAALQGQGLTAATTSPPPPITDDLTNVVRQYQQMGDQLLPAIGDRLAATARQLAPMYTRGWRP